MKNENLKRIANIILIIGIVLTLIGAMYIVIVQQGYAISACFVLASALMVSLLVLLWQCKGISVFTLFGIARLTYKCRGGVSPPW